MTSYLFGRCMFSELAEGEESEPPVDLIECHEVIKKSQIENSDLKIKIFYANINGLSNQ